jgi:hypothetical protein
MPASVRSALVARGLMKAYRERPPYQQNDYLGWIARAARESTRRKRLAQMLTELKAGDRYMKMAWRPCANGRRRREREPETRTGGDRADADMKQALAGLIAAFVLLAPAFPARAEPPAIQVWPGIAPGSETWTQKEVEYLNPEGERMVRNVVGPTLMPFLPNA